MIPGWLQRYRKPGHFKLKNVTGDDFYDVKGAFLGPWRFLAIQEVGLALGQAVVDLEPHLYDDLRLAGVEGGGILVAAMLSFPHVKELFLVRDERHARGLCRRVERGSDYAAPVVLVDDVTTSGKTLIEAAKALEAEGLKVRLIFAVVDRGGGAKVRAAGYKFAAAYPVG